MTDSPALLVLFLSALLLMSFIGSGEIEENSKLESNDLQEQIYASDNQQNLKDITE